MKRFVPLVAAGAVLALVGGAVAWALTDDGPAAFTVRGRTVSQSTIDDELRELAQNEALRTAIVGQGGTPLSAQSGSIQSEVSAGWVGLVVAQEAAAAEVEHRGLDVSAGDRTRGEALATESVGGSAVFTTLSTWFQERLVARWTKVALLERRLLANPTDSLERAVAAGCPSARYVSHVLVETEAEATAVKAALDAGDDFADIAASTPTGPSGTPSGPLGCLDGTTFPEPFATVATTQPVGVVSDPVQTEFGFHLVLVTDQPSAADYEQLALDVVLSGSRGTAVDLDPRYGVWQRSSGQVAPPPVRGVVTEPALSAG